MPDLSLDNPAIWLYISAMAGGILLARVQALWSFLHGHIKQRFTTSVEVRGGDLFDHVGEHIRRQSYGQRCRNLTAEYDYRRAARGEAVPVAFLPGFGTHVFRFKGAWLWVEKEKQKTGKSDGPGESIFEPPTVRLRTFGRSSQPVLDFVREAAQVAFEERRSRLTLYRLRWNSWEETLSEAPPRPLDSVVLAAGQMERLMGDVERFMARKTWYHAQGIPWRRGYLLAGPPGTGKSSLVVAIAAHYGLPIYILSLSTMHDESVQNALGSVPPNSVVLIEDVDAASASALARTDDAPAPVATERPPLTLAGLLNAIDGAGSSEGRLLFMTSNHADRLDGALVRDGRVDLRLDLDLLTYEQALRMWRRFFETSEDGAAVDAALHCAGRISPAQLQGCVLRALDEKQPEWAAMHAVRDLAGPYDRSDMTLLGAPPSVPTLAN